MRYHVLCQDAVGRKTEVTVHADTDQRACDAALRTLNSWRAVRAMPTVTKPIPSLVERTVERAEEDDHDVEHAVEPEIRQPKTVGRIVHKATVADHRGRVGNLGRALRKACE